MDKSKFFIRIKTKECNEIFKDCITPQSTISDLKNEVRNKFGMSNVKIFHSYPPKLIDSPDSENLEQCGVKNGDTLYVETETSVIVPDFVNNDGSEVTMNEDDTRTVKRTNYSHITDNIPRNGIILRREVASDNSCLFTSVGFLLSGKVDKTVSPFMRQLVVQAIRNKPEEYTDAILGKSVEDYCKWMLQPTTWGGAIEIAILCEHYGVELVVANTKTAVMTRFGEDKNYAHRGFLIFDGIHYDPLYMDFLEQNENIQTLFPAENTEVFIEVEQLLNEAKSSKQYVDVKEVNLSCVTCGFRVTGCNNAHEHTHHTGHVEFDEISD